MRWALLLVMASAGCADPLPPGFSAFSDCTRGRIREVETGRLRAEFECEIQNDLLIVALPGRPVSADELIAAGVSKGIADSFAHTDTRKSEWCTAEEFPTDPNPDRSQQLTSRSQCLLLDELQIDDVAQTRARRVRLVIERSPEGHPKLKVFEPATK